MRIGIIKPGLLSTIQDTGRRLHLAEAVPVSGAVDAFSARIANKALGNKDDCAVIELTYGGAHFSAQTDILIAWAGSGPGLQVNKKTLQPGKPVFIPAGYDIKQAGGNTGCRTYLAIAGGWDVPVVMGSRSTYVAAGIGGFKGRALAAGDVLNNVASLTATTAKILAALRGETLNYTNWHIPGIDLPVQNPKKVRVTRSREYDWFDAHAVKEFFTTVYKIGVNSNRMGLNLEGHELKRISDAELLSTAVVPGTVQVTGGGTPVLLLADCQTTGGYPRIAQVAAVDLPVCGQLKPGDSICFKEITPAGAEMLYIEQEEHLHKLSLGVQQKYL